MEIVVFEAEPWEREVLAGLDGPHRLKLAPERLSAENASRFADAEIVSTFVDSRLDRSVLSQLPKLRFIATRSTGYDHIDLAWCGEHGVAVSNVPDYGDATVAEHAFALLLAVARHLVEAVERTRRGDFSQTGLRGIELRGRTLGVVGTGRIGRRAIEIARGFGMSVLAYDVARNAAAEAELGFRYANLDEVLAKADVVTLHVPATPETGGLISEREFALMRPGAILINTARGAVIDVPALVRALSEGRLGAAGLDVLPQEPLIREEAQIFRSGRSEGYDFKGLVANHVLLRFPNVVVTPHVAYDTDAAVRRILETTLANIEAFLAGAPRNLVAPGR